jgi:hypothetical protein
MKKIIAAAVATAFVAPAFAADVSVSGTTIFNYITDDRAATGDKVATDDQAITVKATQELSNGMTVTSTFNLVHDGAANDLDNQGSNLTIAGDFGKLGIGDVSGALDATGDWTDISPVFGGYRADGDDMNMNWTLPAIVPNLTINASYSPDGANLAGDDPFSTQGLGGSAYSLTYNMGSVAVYYGSETYDENHGEANVDSYGVKYSSGPIYFAVEVGSGDNMDQSASALSVLQTSATDDKNYDFAGVAGSYKMGDTTLGFEQQTAEEKGTSGNTKVADETTVFVAQSLGGGVTVYAATSTDAGSSAQTDVTRNALGIKFAF